MKSKVCFQVSPYGPEPTSSQSPPRHESIEMTEDDSTPTPAFSKCPCCKGQVDPGGVLPESAKIPVPVSMGHKNRWSRRQWLLLAMYGVLTILMGIGFVGAFVLIGGMGIIYGVPVFILVMFVAYCATQSKREKKRVRNTIILRNCKSCRQRLHLQAVVNNKIVQ